MSNPIRKRSATARRLTVVLITGWTALVVARPFAAASPAAIPTTSEPGAAQQSSRTVGAPEGPAGWNAPFALLKSTNRTDSPLTRRIAGRSDHAAAHTTINFSALARDEANGVFAAARRKSTPPAMRNPFADAPASAEEPSSVDSRDGSMSSQKRKLAKGRKQRHPVLIGVPGLGDNGTAIPPDTDGAVGPAHLMVALNSQIEIENRAGTLISAVSLLNFWSSLGVGTVTDPRVIYDPYGQHWVLVIAADPETTSSAILIGVSNNSDPTAGWNLYRVPIDSTGNFWGDFPTLGFNKNWIVVGINIFTIEGNLYEFANLYAFDKANLYAGGSGLFTLLQDDTGGFSMNPALTYDPNLATPYVLESWSSANGLLRISAISGAVGSEVLTTGIALPDAPQPWQAVEPTLNFAPQLGSTRDIDTDGDRLDWTVYRNGSLWTAQTIFLPATGTPNRCSVQWWQIDTTPGDVGGVQQLGRIDDPTAAQFFAYPSIGVNRENDAVVGYSQFSSAEYASAGFSMRMAADPPNTLRQNTLLKAGLGPYFKDFGTGDNRWGDFSTTTVDPLDDLTLWTLQEYAAASNSWGTWWGEISVGPTPTATPSPSPTPTPSPSPTPTPSPTPSSSPTPRPTPTPTSTPTAVSTPSPIPTPSPTRTPSPTPTPSPIPTPSPTPTPSPSPSPTATPLPTSSPTPIATPTPALTIGAASLRSGTVGIFYRASLELGGGTPPYTVFVSVGALPRGLALDTFDGEISGIPGAAGTSTFTVYATDRSHQSASRTFQISIER